MELVVHCVKLYLHLQLFTVNVVNLIVKYYYKQQENFAFVFRYSLFRFLDIIGSYIDNEIFSNDNNHMLLRQTLKLVEYIIDVRYDDAHDSCQRKFKDKQVSLEYSNGHRLSALSSHSDNSKLPFDRDAPL